MSLALREAAPADLERLLDLDERASGDRAWSPSGWSAVLDARDATVWLAEEGQATGFLAVRWIADEGHVQTVGVVPEARRQGVARALLDQAASEGRRRGVTAWLLEVRVDNSSARALYENLGYAEVGRRPRYYACGADAVLMTCKV